MYFHHYHYCCLCRYPYHGCYLYHCFLHKYYHHCQNAIDLIFIYFWFVLWFCSCCLIRLIPMLLMVSLLVMIHNRYSTPSEFPFIVPLQCSLWVIDYFGLFPFMGPLQCSLWVMDYFGLFPLLSKLHVLPMHVHCVIFDVGYNCVRGCTLCMCVYICRCVYAACIHMYERVNRYAYACVGVNLGMDVCMYVCVHIVLVSGGGLAASLH